MTWCWPFQQISISDVFGEEKSGSGRVRGSKFRDRLPRVSGFSRVFKLKSRVGVGSGSNFRGRGSQCRGRPPRVSGFSEIIKLKFMVGVGSGSTFRGRVGFGYQTFGDISLWFWGFGSPNTSLGQSKKHYSYILGESKKLWDVTFQCLSCQFWQQIHISPRRSQIWHVSLEEFRG